MPIYGKNSKHCSEKHAWLFEYKSSNGCFVCGERDPIVLEFHHKDPKTKDPMLKPQRGRARGLSFFQMGWDRMKSEVVKCEVVCANCHKRITFAEKRKHLL